MWALARVLLGLTSRTDSTVIGVALLLAVGAVFGLGETLWAPIFPAIINDLAPDELRGRYNSASSAVWGISSVIGPLLAGALIGAGLSTLWLAILIAGLVLGAGGALALRRGLDPTVDGRTAAAVGG